LDTQLIKTIVLGIIQGLTEWLPISSTGHLKVLQQFLGLNVPLLFDVVLHVGTLTVVMVFFRNDIKKISLALARFDFKTDDGRLIPLIIVGTIPTVVIGFVFSTFLENLFQNISIIALAFTTCGILLYSAKIGKEKTDNITFSEAFVIGIAQGIAVIPGFSRSGLTIATALLLGIKRGKAFKFSFLLSIPAIIGALALTLCKELDRLAASGVGWVEVAAGTVTAMVVGYLALGMLRKVLAKKKFHLFAFYCWTAGIFLMAASYLRVF